MKNSVKILMLLATMMFSFASVMYANPINCSVTPSDPSCAPTMLLTYQVGSGPTQTMSPTTPVFSNGSWLAEYTPQTFPDFLFTGGQVASSPDPFVGFSFGIINSSGHTMTFNYDFITPYAGGPYAFVQSVFGDVLIDTNFVGTSTIKPVGTKYVMNTYDTGNLINMVDLGKGCTTPVSVYVCSSPDDGAIGPLPYVSLASGILEVQGSFTVTAGGQYTLTGRSALLPVPEPGTLALLGTGVLGLGGWLRRRL